MNENPRLSAFSAAITQYALKPFTVINLRDSMLELNCDIGVRDKAQLRRWVYGKLTTLVRQGAMISNKSSVDGKTYFKVNNDADSPSHQEIHCTHTRLERTDMAGIVDTLTSKLEVARTTSIVREEELRTYKRMHKEHPSLAPTIDALFDTSTHDHTRALGEIAALEKLVQALQK